MEQQNYNAALEPAAKVLAATAVSQSLSFCMERKYLQNITTNPVFEIDAIDPTATDEAAWIAIEQIGKPLEKSAENCFTAIQKILYSCFLPKEVQLLFLVTGSSKENHLFLGIRTPGKAMPPKSMVRNMNEFIKGVWPGLQTQIVKEDHPVISGFKKSVSDDCFENVFALTGIPSMESQYKTLYPATIDKLIAGMNKSKNYAYLVVADPVETTDAEAMLFQCREMNGQAESLKSLNVTEGMSQGTSSSHTSSHTDSHSTSVSESVSKRDFTKLGKMAVAATGLGMAASVFPAAGAVLSGCVDAAGALTSAAVGLLGGSVLGNLVSGLMPQKTTSHSTSVSVSDTKSQTIGVNESKSQSMSRNLVNKHIESVSEHLFYHSKRIETGKAIGLWNVGVYLMADKKSDLQGGSLQLRSILSGQESIFEPIRIHDISSILEENVTKESTMRELTLGRLAAPQLVINDIHGRRFEHPLGKHFQELKTILTTKELSYLINFPLRSVPGINVVDSSPEFLLSQSTNSSNASSVCLGKFLYGGTPTDIDFQLPLNALFDHILVTGNKGYGKSQVVKTLIENLNQQVPFLIIEPSKTEYVDWALTYNQKHPEHPIKVFMPGRNTINSGSLQKEMKIDPLHLNPLEIIWEEESQQPNILPHIDTVKKIISASVPMVDSMNVVVEDLLCNVYQNGKTDWISCCPDFSNRTYPSLKDVQSQIGSAIEALGFDLRTTQQITAGIHSRINNLLMGWKGDLFGSEKSTPWELLFDGPCVINLSCLHDEAEKQIAINTILMFLCEYRQIQNRNKNAHITVVENAHTIFSKHSEGLLKNIVLNSSILSELTYSKEGVILVDSNPASISDEIVRDFGTKLILRTVGEMSTKTIVDSTGINKEQALILPKLKAGQCVVSSAIAGGNYWITIN